MRNYLRNTTQYSKMLPSLNRYGEPEYSDPVELRCRRERLTRDIETANGALLKSFARYYLTDEVSPQVGDRLDGNEIISLSELVSSSGKIVGYECYV